MQRQDLECAKTSNHSSFEFTLEPKLKAQWINLAEKSKIPNRQKFVQWLELADENSIVGFGNLPFGHQQSDNNHPECWYWIPVELEALPTLSVVSSHLGKDWTKHPGKLDAIRTAVAGAASDQMQILTAENTTTDKLVRRAAARLAVPVTFISRLNSSHNADWYLEQLHEITGNQMCRCFVWPARDNVSKRQSWLDSLVIANADRVLAVFVREGGTVHSELKKRLSNADINKSITLVYRDQKSAVQSDELIERGAVQWFMYDKKNTVSNQKLTSPNKQFHSIANADIDWSQWLIHLTRSQPEAWPDETEGEFLDSLLFGLEGRDCLAALMRIVSQGRIIAGQDMIRGHFPMVCFSNVDPINLTRQRTFRSHLNRWDYEPFGIAVGKRYIESIGGKPVIYGDQCTWNVLKESERPYYQKNASETEKQEIDWEKENEWRIFGDLDLIRVPIDDVMVLVDTSTNAAKIDPLSRWPVMTIQDSSAS